jgi:DNA polymerase-3 subunit epsilon
MDAVERNAYIRRLVARLPAEVSADPLLDDYFAVLDRVLEDRRVLPEEASALEDLARSLGISRHAAVDAHRRYMSGLIAVALRDGTITPAEMVDLEQVRDLLGLSSADLAELVKTARVADNDREDNSAVPPASNLAGKSVCFTGTFSCLLKGERGTKETAAQLAADAGMHVRKGVTKKLDMLVAADPDSMSGKARKARQYGIRIVAEPVFWRMMGVDIE